MNPNGSRYHNNGRGYSRYWTPDATDDEYVVITDGFEGMHLEESLKKVLRILGQPPEPGKREEMIAAMQKWERAKAERKRQQAESDRQQAERQRLQAESERERIRNERAQRKEQGTQTENHIEEGMRSFDRLHTELAQEDENLVREEREKAARHRAERRTPQREMEGVRAQTERWSFTSPPSSSSKRSAIKLESDDSDLYNGTPTPTKRVKKEPTVITIMDVVDLTQDDDSLPSQEFLNTPSSLPASLPIRSRIPPPKFGLPGVLGQNAIGQIASQNSQDPF